MTPLEKGRDINSLREGSMVVEILDGNGFGKVCQLIFRSLKKEA